MDDLINWIYRFIQEFPSAQQWIPCSERLPAEGEPVLLCDRGGCMTLGRLVRTDEGCKWDIGTWWSDIEDGDAWMPLPKAYKGEDHG